MSFAHSSSASSPFDLNQFLETAFILNVSNQSHQEQKEIKANLKTLFEKSIESLKTSNFPQYMQIIFEKVPKFHIQILFRENHQIDPPKFFLFEREAINRLSLLYPDTEELKKLYVEQLLPEVFGKIYEHLLLDQAYEDIYKAIEKDMKSIAEMRALVSSTETLKDPKDKIQFLENECKGYEGRTICIFGIKDSKEQMKALIHHIDGENYLEYGEFELHDPQFYQTKTLLNIRAKLQATNVSPLLALLNDVCYLYQRNPLPSRKSFHFFGNFQNSPVTQELLKIQKLTLEETTLGEFLMTLSKDLLNQLFPHYQTEANKWQGKFSFGSSNEHKQFRPSSLDNTQDKAEKDPKKEFRNAF